MQEGVSAAVVLYGTLPLVTSVSAAGGGFRGERRGRAGGGEHSGDGAECSGSAPWPGTASAAHRPRKPFRQPPRPRPGPRRPYYRSACLPESSELALAWGRFGTACRACGKWVMVLGRASPRAVRCRAAGGAPVRAAPPPGAAAPPACCRWSTPAPPCGPAQPCQRPTVNFRLGVELAKILVSHKISARNLWGAGTADCSAGGTFGTRPASLPGDFPQVRPMAGAAAGASATQKAP